MISQFWLVSFHMSERGVATFSLPSFDWLAALARQSGQAGGVGATHAALKARSPTRLLSGHFDCSVHGRKNKGREACSMCSSPLWASTPRTSLRVLTHQDLDSVMEDESGSVSLLNEPQVPAVYRSKISLGRRTRSASTQ